MLNFQDFYFVTGKMLFLRRFGRKILHIYLKIFIFQLHNHKNQGKFLLSCVTICIVCDVVFYYGFSSPNPKGHVNFCHYLVSAICVLPFRILVIFTETKRSIGDKIWGPLHNLIISFWSSKNITAMGNSCFWLSETVFWSFPMKLQIQIIC